jgi:glutathione synthase/RimK-type ligase-like ATP-grasp enzyme
MRQAIMSQLTVIGARERVDFPELSLRDVPAKVDTGADGSAIWATNVIETDATLTFMLFGPGSPFYTGKVISTQQYKKVIIRNSFGHVERRYKVRLQMRLSRRLIRAWFTLADRSNNNFPILIGRRTLNGKFVVDVRKGRADASIRLLMMSNRMTSAVRLFIKSVEQHAGGRLNVTHTTYDDVQFSFDAAGPHIILRSTGEDVASFDAVHFKVKSKSGDITASMAYYLQKRGIPAVDGAVAHFSDSSKLYQYTILSCEGVALPDSEFVTPSRLAESFDFLVGRLDLPFILKDIHANKGERNYLIRDLAQFKKICDQVVVEGVYPIAQRFVPNDGDYRILIMGRRIALVIHRRRTGEGTHLNNTSKGGSGRIVPADMLPPKVRAVSLFAAELMERGIVGVDMVQDSATKRWYCLEVNDGPQIATGTFTQEKQQAFAAYVLRDMELKR